MIGARRHTRVGNWFGATLVIMLTTATGLAGFGAAPAGAITGPNPVVAIGTPPDPVAPSQVATTPITVENTGDADAAATIVTVTYPKSVSGSFSVGFVAAAGVTCTVYNPRYGARRATCTLPTVAAGATAPVGTAKVTAPASVSYAGANVNVSAVGPLNSASATFRIRGSGPADLVPSVYVSPSTVLIDQPVTATLNIADYGYTAAANFSTRIDLPTGANPGTPTVAAGTSCALNGDGFDCTTTTLANGATTTITVPFGAPHTGALAAVNVTVDAANVVAETNEANNAASATLDVRGSAAALHVAITNPATSDQGTVFTRTIEVTNVGGSTASAVALTDRFTGIGYVAASGPVGTSCRVLTSYSGRPARIHYIGATCTLGSIAPGATTAIALRLSIPGTMSAGAYADTAAASTPDYTDPSVVPSATGTTTVTVPAVPAPPTNTVAPILSGNPNVGSPLTVSNGTWVAKGAVAYTYRWLQCDNAGSACTQIGGATTNSYVVQAADVGFTVRGVVDATNAGGTSSAASDPSALAVPAAAPVNDIAPQLIPGLEKQPTFLWSVAPGTWSGTPTITFTYQWMRCNIGGGNCVDIAGANTQGYVLQTADVFHSVQVRVTATNTGGSTIAYSNVSEEIDPYG